MMPILGWSCDTLLIQGVPQLTIQKVSEKISIDGVLSESAWLGTEVATDFQQKWPVDTAIAKTQTHVTVLYDEQFLYIGATCDHEGESVIQALKRDQQFFDSEGFSVVLDPQNNQSNGYFFGVIALGSQSDGLINSVGDLNFSWDSKWFGNVHKTDTSWTVEIAIPLSSIRYSAETKAWGINFIRNDINGNMYSVWSKIPRVQSILTLGYNGLLNWPTPPPTAKRNVVLNP